MSELTMYQAARQVLLTAVYYPDDAGGYYAVSPRALEYLAKLAGFPISLEGGNYGLENEP